MVSKILVLSALFSVAFAGPHARSMKVREARKAVPSGFVRSGDANPDEVLNLRIALVQNNPEGLIDALYDVSTPSSANYGQHLSKEEVEALVAPKPETADAVKAWLKEAGLTPTTASPAGDWLSVSVPVSKANELFDADFAVFKNTASGETAIRTLQYSIPTELDGHLDFVHPTISFATVTSPPVITAPVAISNSTIDPQVANCSPNAVTPACIQSLYGVPTTPATHSSNKLGVSGFIQQFANQADLSSFLRQFRSDINPNTAFTLQTLDGGSNPQGSSQAGVEANLDIQYTVGVATGVPVTFISVGSQNQDGISGFLDIINFLIAQSAPPQVLTTSYGFDEPGLPSSLANNLCNAYAQLGARGVSILFASGDGGVAGSRNNACTNFVPTFPSGCPFLTSVGATAITSAGSETSASFSSGGFSNIFAQPSYQSSAVSSYLSGLGSTNSGKFNRTGRAFPDVSAIGEVLEIVVSGSVGGVEGTSCSSPIFASLVSLINDKLIGAGKSPLGFLNPFLYANPGAFNDVTTGSNPGCNTNGFPAKAGWDPVTGLGTPSFSRLSAAAGV